MCECFVIVILSGAMSGVLRECEVGGGVNLMGLAVNDSLPEKWSARFLQVF